MFKKVSIKTINKNKTRKTLLNVFMLTFIMFVISMSTVYALSYTVSYNNNGGSGTMSNSTFTSNPGTLSTNTFTKSGYKFMGWNKNSSATSDWYRQNNSFTGTDGSSTTLYAQWCKNSQGTIKISNNEVKDTYGNYVFRNNKYITVKADNKTITYGGTPSYSYTVTGTLLGETGVTGTATYTVKDGSNNTIDPSSAAVGSYTIYVSGLSGATGYSIQNTNTGTLTINILQCNAPTNVAVSTAGIVTWTPSSNCPSVQHQISMDGTNWTNATSGVDYLSTIIASTGTKTVKVRAVAPNANYTTSNAGTATATVYTITFASNDTNKGTVSPTNYNVISGATVTTNNDNLLIEGITTESTTTTLITIIPTAKTGYHYDNWSKTSGSLTSTQTITATFSGDEYAVTYNAGATCTSATGMPAAQAKIHNVDLTLQTGTPTCTGKAFLGWSTTSSAGSSDTWYDSGDTYTIDAPLKLYAQFYDVDSLEQEYTTYVQSGDFSYVDIDTSTNSNTYDGTNIRTREYRNCSFNGASVGSGYSGYTLMGYLISPRRIYNVQYACDVGTVGWSGRLVIGGTENEHLYRMTVKTRSSQNYSDSIDDRIDRLQKIKDVALTYDDINTTGTTHDNLTINPKNNPVTVTNNPTSGWDYVSNAGFDISNASNSGIGMSRVYVTGNYFENDATVGRRNKMILLNADLSTSSTPAKVKLITYFVEARQKEARSTTFAPATAKGLTRYNALVALNDDKNNYFPASYIKIYTASGATISTTAWGSGLATKNVYIPNGKILGVVEHGVLFDYNTSQTSNGTNTYASINKTIVTGMNTTSGSLYMRFYGGNETNATNAGHVMTNVYGRGRIIYISSGYMSDGPQYPTVTYNAGETCTEATNMPELQTKMPNTDLTLQTGIPTCTGKVFLGWSTTSNAGSSDTWYDPGDTYTTDANLTLYAQFYDVTGLEQEYTTFVQSGDFTTTSDSVENSANYPSAGSAANYTWTKSSNTGYVYKWTASFNDWNLGSFRYYTASCGSTISAGVRTMAASIAGDILVDNRKSTWVKTRTATSYSGDVDDRIDRLQKLQDVALKLNEIRTTNNATDNISLSAAGMNTLTFTGTTNYTLISPMGWALANASSSGIMVSRVGVECLGTCSIMGGYNEAEIRDWTSGDTNSKVQITLYWLEALNKSARTTTFAPTSGKGLARYNALVALNSEKSNYFDASQIKLTSWTSTTSLVSPSAWAYAYTDHTLSVPNGKILGVVGYGVNNGSGGSNMSAALIEKAHLLAGGYNATSATVRVGFHGGNTIGSSNTGTNLVKVYGRSQIVYISSGTITISSGSSVVGS